MPIARVEWLASYLRHLRVKPVIEARSLPFDTDRRRAAIIFRIQTKRLQMYP